MEANGATNLVLPLDNATSVDIPVPAYLPEDYVPGLEVRLALYQRLARMRETTGVDELAGEMQDRFGRRPTEVENLLYLLKLKLMASQRGIMRIAREGKQVVVFLGPEARVDGRGMQGVGRRVRVGSRQVRIDMDMTMKGWQRMLEKVVGQIDVPEGEVQAHGRKARGCGGSALSMCWDHLFMILKSRPWIHASAHFQPVFTGMTGMQGSRPASAGFQLGARQRRILQRRMLHLQQLQFSKGGPSGHLGAFV